MQKFIDAKLKKKKVFYARNFLNQRIIKKAKTNKYDESKPPEPLKNFEWRIENNENHKLTDCYAIGKGKVYVERKS